MTPEEFNNMKYKVCCPLCDNDECVKGTDKCEAEIWAKQKESESEEEKAVNELGKSIHVQSLNAVKDWLDRDIESEYFKKQENNDE